MKKVLLVTYFFPPRPPEFAGRHAAALARYLPESGWEPLVLTAALPVPRGTALPAVTPYRTVQTPYRDSLRFFKKLLGIRSEDRLMMNVAELKKKLHVKSERSVVDAILRLGGEFLAYPDPQKGWRSPAVGVGSRLLDSEQVDAIVSISPPVTSHLIAAELNRDHGIPWAAYFLDLWTQNHYYPYSRFRRARERRLELRALGRADVLASVSQPLADKLGQLHSGKDVRVIRLGFDPDELVESPPPLSAKFTITYTGNIYPGKQSPEPLFKALANLITRGVVNPQDVEVRFFGPELGWVDRLVDRYRLDSVVRQYGMVPRRVSLEKQRESQVLLILGWLDPGELGVYTAKVYEYLAACRPILAVGGSTSDVLSALLEDTGTGTLCPTAEETGAWLERAYGEYRAQGQVAYRGDRDRLTDYSYQQMGRGFGELLHDLAPAARSNTAR
jgi:hypothetical protein